VSVLKTDVSVLKTDVSVLKTDVSVLKTDVSVLKTDMSVVKTDVTELKSDVSDIKSVMRRMASAIVRIEKKFDDMPWREDMRQLESRLNQRFDGLAGRIQDFDLRQAVQAGTLLDHDSRMRVLEAEAARLPSLKPKTAS
jgi:chromosome segregation ATPase